MPNQTRLDDYLGDNNYTIFDTVDTSDKISLDINVYEATKKRLRYIFDNFDNYYFSVSFGKDSSVMLQIALQVAEPDDLPLKVLFIDLEAQYKKTIDHATEMIIDNPGIEAYWICLPLNLRNAVSIYEPFWICWDPSKQDKWIREMPDYDCVINIDNLPEEWNWYYQGMEFEEFVPKFGRWMSDDGITLTATIIGNRANESLHRFKSVKKDNEDSMHDGLNWTTIIGKNQVNVYPIYDWKTEDIWTAVGKFNFKYNRIYDFMYMTGRSIHEMRICQPYGDDQRDGLDLFRKVEPATWGRVVERVAGANYGNIYRKLKILGNGQIIKPDDYTWREYSNFLLNTIPKWQAHIYKERWVQFLEWWEDEGWDISGIPDEQPPKEDVRWKKGDGTDYSKLPSYSRLAKAILKNDINCKTLGFGLVVGGYPRIQRLKEKYGEKINMQSTFNYDRLDKNRRYYD